MRIHPEYRTYAEEIAIDFGVLDCGRHMACCCRGKLDREKNSIVTTVRVAKITTVLVELLIVAAAQDNVC